MSARITSHFPKRSENNYGTAGGLQHPPVCANENSTLHWAWHCWRSMMRIKRGNKQMYKPSTKRYQHFNLRASAILSSAHVGYRALFFAHLLSMASMAKQRMRMMACMRWVHFLCRKQSPTTTNVDIVEKTFGLKMAEVLTINIPRYRANERDREGVSPTTLHSYGSHVNCVIHISKWKQSGYWTKRNANKKWERVRERERAGVSSSSLILCFSHSYKHIFRQTQSSQNVCTAGKIQCVAYHTFRSHVCFAPLLVVIFAFPFSFKSPESLASQTATTTTTTFRVFGYS